MTTMIAMFGGLGLIVFFGAGIYVGVLLSGNRPVPAPDLDGLIEQVRNYPDPEKAVYMIVRKVRGESFHIHRNPTKKEVNTRGI